MLKVNAGFNFIILCANSADDKLMIFLYFFFQENRLWHFMQIVSGDNMHEMSKPIFLEKISFMSAKIFTHMLRVKNLHVIIISHL